MVGIHGHVLCLCPLLAKVSSKCCCKWLSTCQKVSVSKGFTPTKHGQEIRKYSNEVTTFNSCHSVHKFTLAAPFASVIATQQCGHCQWPNVLCKLIGEMSWLQSMMLQTTMISGTTTNPISTRHNQTKCVFFFTSFVSVSFVIRVYYQFGFENSQKQQHQTCTQISLKVGKTYKHKPQHPMQLSNHPLSNVYHQHLHYIPLHRRHKKEIKLDNDENLLAIFTTWPIQAGEKLLSLVFVMLVGGETNSQSLPVPI